MGVRVVVSVVRTTNNFLACYGKGRLDFNLFRLGHKWFEQGVTEDVDRLLIHEFGHQYLEILVNPQSLAAKPPGIMLIVK
jgi:hypothetical protein